MNGSPCRLMILSLAIVLDPARVLSLARGAEVPSLDQVLRMEKQVIESRRGIRAGRVVLSYRLTKYTRDPSQANVPKRFVTYFEGEKIRCDREVSGHRGQMVFSQDTYIRADEGDRYVAVFGPNTRPKDSGGLPDPRRLGIVPWFYDSINIFGYEEALQNPNRDQFKIEVGTEGGETVWKVSFRLKRGVYTGSTEYWLSEAKGGLPVYLAIRFEEGKGDFSARSVATKWKQYGSSKVWFPSQAVFRLTYKDGIAAEEIVTVEEAVLEDRLPAETFTLAGLGLPKGRLVDVDGKVMVWDGNRLVKQEASEALPFAQGGEDSSRTFSPRLFLFWASIFLALAAAVLMWYRSIRRRTAGLGRDG